MLRTSLHPDAALLLATKPNVIAYRCLNGHVFMVLESADKSLQKTAGS